MQPIPQVLEQHPTTSEVLIREETFVGPLAWSRDSLSPQDGLIRLSAACLDELDNIVSTVRHNSLQMELLTPDQFDLPSCRDLMLRAKAILDDGVGFVVIDLVPTTKYTVDENKTLYWVLMQLLERPVAQDKLGKLVYDVRDTGKPRGNGVRGVLTSAGQPFHTDNNFNLCPPEYVSLFCLQTAMEGGLNSIVSFYTVYNEILRRHPELVARLYQPFLFDRIREHDPDEPMVISHPIFEYDGSRLKCRFSHTPVISGYKLVNRSIDELGQKALDALETIMGESKYHKECFFVPGQIQIVNNTACGHRRTAFKDFPEPERKRHLVRLWLRGKGRRFYNG